MDKIVVEGGTPLKGVVQVSGAKNAALPILFSTLLAPGKHILNRVPNLQDVLSTFELLKSLNVKSDFKDHVATLFTEEPQNMEAHYDLVRKMRASVLCLGPLLARYGHARVSLPGGCAIGARPINLHLDALKKMGAEIKIEEGYVEARCKRLQGAKIIFDGVTVTGTENIMMAAALAKGTTILQNCAKEPEVANLGEYLNEMGAKVYGAGTETMTIEGVDNLNGASATIIADRIEAGTLVVAGAITGGEIEVQDFDPLIIEALTLKLREIGFTLNSLTGSKKGLKVTSPKTWNAIDVVTAPYPGFATDLQAQFMALMCFAQGTSTIKETIFENRFMHVQELSRLGADIQIKNQVAVIKGNKKAMTGAPVMATDLRASASLVLAGLGSQGKTTISRIYHLDRGYENLEKKLRALGAKIERVP